MVKYVQVRFCKSSTVTATGTRFQPKWALRIPKILNSPWRGRVETKVGNSELGNRLNELKGKLESWLSIDCTQLSAVRKDNNQLRIRTG